MRARLMFGDHDFDPDHTEAPGEADLIQDLDLATLWAAAAGDDRIVHASVRTAMLEPLTEPAAIDYRSDVLADCFCRPAIIRRLYELACQAIDQERQIYRASFYSHSSEALLDRSVTALRTFVVVLKHLREVADQCTTGFSSTGLCRFFATLESELTDNYFAEIDDHLQILRFHDGLVATARLGRHSQGTNYVLRTAHRRNEKRLLPRQPPVKRPYHSRTIPRGDEGGHQDLAGLRDRMVALAADSLAQAAAHILSFFTALRAELAFYMGCLNLHQQFTAKSLHLCRPQPHALTPRTWTARGVYDPCLALRSTNPVHGNDLAANDRQLLMITGANQGGKSTFLRSLGLAQLMMQAGMPAPAQAFTASTVTAVVTHYARSEDITMLSGKFDE